MNILNLFKTKKRLIGITILFLGLILYLLDIFSIFNESETLALYWIVLECIFITIGALLIILNSPFDTISYTILTVVCFTIILLVGSLTQSGYTFLNPEKEITIPSNKLKIIENNENLYIELDYLISENIKKNPRDIKLVDEENTRFTYIPPRNAFSTETSIPYFTIKSDKIYISLTDNTIKGNYYLSTPEEKYITIAKKIRIRVWLLSFSLIPVYCILYRRQSRSRRYRFILSTALFLTMGISLFLNYWNEWDYYILAHDSLSYIQNKSHRPPVYPIFIDLLTSEKETEKSFNYEKYAHIYTKGTNSLINVVRVQKVLLIIGLLTLSISLSIYMSNYTATLICLFLASSNFLTIYQNLILTETITQAFLLFLISLFIFFTRFKNKIILISSTVIAALMFLTRAQASYAWVCCTIMILIYLHHKKYKAVLPISIALFAGIIISLFPALNIYFKQSFFSVSPYGGRHKLYQALSVAKTEDSELFNSKEMSNYFLKLLKNRDEQDLSNIFNRIKACRNAVSSTDLPLKINSKDELETHVWKSKQYSSVANTLFKVRKKDYINEIFLPQFKMGLAEGAIIKSPPKHLYLTAYVFIILLVIWIKGWAAISAVCFSLIHITSVAIVSWGSVITKRHLLDTEFLIILSLCILLSEVIEKLLKKIYHRVH